MPVLDAGRDVLHLTELELAARLPQLAEEGGRLGGRGRPDRLVGRVHRRLPLGDALEQVRQKANEELAALKRQLPREFAVDMAVTELHVDRLAVDANRYLAVVTARGKMSAVLKP